MDCAALHLWQIRPMQLNWLCSNYNYTKHPCLSSTHTHSVDTFLQVCDKSGGYASDPNDRVLS